MMNFISRILPILKYWKTGGVILLIAAFLLSFHFAKTRGEKLQETTQILNAERQKFQTQLKMIEKERQDDRERNKFRTKQAKKFKLADTDSLRDAYDSLRERQASRAAR